jgi:hypothetical protein
LIVSVELTLADIGFAKFKHIVLSLSEALVLHFGGAMTGSKRQGKCSITFTHGIAFRRFNLQARD